MHLTKTAAPLSTFSPIHVLVYDYGLRLSVKELKCDAAQKSWYGIESVQVSLYLIR